jgi:hypothetical protein
VTKKSVFEKLMEEGVPGAKSMEHLLQVTIHQQSFPLYLHFLYEWERWEKILSEEDKQKMYELMDEEMVMLSAELQQRPMKSSELTKKCVRLYNKMNERE